MSVKINFFYESKSKNYYFSACIVNEEKHVVGIGYNGFPISCSDERFTWDKSEDPLKNKHTYVVHAEQNGKQLKNIFLNPS